MTRSVQINPLLEIHVEVEARHLCVRPSEFVQDVPERALGMKNPADIYRRVCSFTPMGDPDASEDVADKVKARLRTNFPD